MLTRAVRLFHTVRYLRPVQIYGRAAHRLRRLRPRLGPPPAVRAVAGTWALPRWRAPSMLGPARFRFLNEEHELAGPGDWDNPAWPRLWLYNLHYFDDLDALGAEGRRAWHAALIARWIAENPPPSGPGWEPYCLSLRIVNWCRFAWSGGRLEAAAVESLAVQVRALADQLEIHLLGNHLWANAKALVFAGLFFEGAEADDWLRLGLKHLVPQLREQVLPDGGHFELSPMYHAIIAADVLDLLAADRIAPARLPPPLAAELAAAAGRMLAWAETMSHPDGEVSFFNDSAMAIAPRAADLTAQLAALRLTAPPPLDRPVRYLESSGYVRAEAGPAVLFADVANVGPDYLPGHAHADTLSCELSLFGARMLVNTGTSTYDAGPDRLWERGTAAHNSVVVDGADSSEVWSSFRVARRARPIEVALSAGQAGVELSAGHTGYRRLQGRVTHRRRWRLDERSLTVEDSIEGRSSSAEAVWLLHPEVQVETARERAVVCILRNRAVQLELDGGEAAIEDAWWAPEFGLRLPTKHVRCRFAGDRLTSRWLWG
ncbi:alginate lyase family protein [Phenylobacterium sp.]|uniref:heparinase II/III family protein n=1 Tax=Phenylobacterium sp. TaxID=1871053 RepID=UPI0028125F3D|nr:alginate lyase family protein [Phenylobacterium sp.]